MSGGGERIVIVGAGHAGGSAAAFLRQFEFTGEIVLIGAEPLAPYQRPPLSKAWLKGEADADSLLLKGPDFYAEANIDLRLATRVTHLDRAERQVVLSDGGRLNYDRLVLATGSSALKLPIPGAPDPRVLELRDAADAQRLKSALSPGARLVVIGAGYVGLEVAASARALGCSVTVIERQPRVLARVASAPLSAAFEARHRREGVEILTCAAVTAIEAGRRVRLEGGASIEGDAVLVGVGAAACEDLAREAGLACEGGVITDAWGRTSDPNVFAVGDCARRPVELAGASLRLESVPNALETARRCAAALTGRPLPQAEVPWFWSDQYDLKLQIAGVLNAPDATVVRGSLVDERFAVFSLSGGRIQAVEAVNAPAEFMAGRQLIARNTRVSAHVLQDPSLTARDLARI